MKDNNLLLAMAAMSSTTLEIIQDLKTNLEECETYTILNGIIDLKENIPDCMKKTLALTSLLSAKFAIAQEGDDIKGMMTFVNRIKSHNSFDDRMFKPSN